MPAASGDPAIDALPFQVNLDNCEREPIHVPGSIQPGGALVAFEPGSGRVLHASANLSRWLQVGPLAHAGATLGDLLGADDAHRLTQALAGLHGSVSRHALIDLAPTASPGRASALVAQVHQHAGLALAEFEPAALGDPPDGWLQAMSETVDALRSATGLDDLVQRLARQVRQLTGFDRVMVYRFDQAHNGQVIAEARQPGLEPFLGLHYPASDIPPQARALYVDNLVRYIADIGYQPVPVQAWPLGTPRPPLDMSHAALRAVSPMHVQYLRNMGVASTLTLSLLVDGRLWGLVACHHHQPSALPLRLRRACHALAVTAGYMTGWFVSQQRLAERDRARQIQGTIVDAFKLVHGPLPEVVARCTVPLLTLVGATGGAFWQGDDVVPFGQWPAPARADALLRRVRQQLGPPDVEQVDTVRVELDPPLDDSDLGQLCGVLAVRLDPQASTGIVWVRPEARYEVHWGGNPAKPMQMDLDPAGQPVLSPRNSFARWTQQVHGHSRPWTALEREVALLGDLRQLLVVRESLAQLQLSDRQFRSLVTLQSETYWQTDPQGRVVVLSKPLPFDAGPWPGRPLKALLAVGCRGVDVDAVAAALQGTRAFSGLRLQGQDTGGRALVLQVNGAPMRSGAGDLTGWHGTLSDITLQAQVEEALEQKAAAELASQTKSRFLSLVSHELRTPLNAVIGFSELVINDPSTPQRQRRHVSHVHQAGKWLLTMISDLLDLSTIETGQLAVQCRPIDARPLLDDTVSLLAAEAAGRSVAMVLPQSTQPVWVMADPARLFQVLINLCSNAVKYNKVGGQVRLSVADDAQAGWVRIEVADTGDGLAPEQLAHLFEPFNRLGREGLTIGGTGIGLVISQHLVSLMGGRIEVHSQLGQGSCFSVLLPQAAAAGDGLPAA